ncbi:MAG: M6 family metalloprotease domain-containing protein [Myxococcales bacterium]|jgi:M6 family metalloprotease-like protein
MKLLWPARLLAASLLLISARAAAVPAPPYPIALHNADGTTVMGRLFGDEHFTWAHDIEGYPLAYDKLDGAWHYATLGPDGTFLPLPHRAGTVAPERLGLIKNLKPSPKALERAAAIKRSLAPQAKPIVPRGPVRNLVLLVKFNCASGCSSVNRYTTYSPSDYEAVFNGYANSVKAFYQEVSYGQLQLTSTVANNQWIQLPYYDAYYASNDYANGNPQEMVRHAVDVLNAQGFDFTQYDADHDGVIDAIDVIHVGPGYESTGNTACIHSHYLDMTLIGAEFRTHDGILINAYHTEPELRDTGEITQIGVIVHETAHFFGLPDLYDYTQQSAGLGMWSLMAAGAWGGPSTWGAGDGTRPTHPDAWSRFRMGWTTPQVLSASASGIRLRPSHSNADVIRVEYGMPSRQFFLIENRQQAGFDQYIPAPGLAIYHVDENRWFDYCTSYNYYECNNNDPSHYLVDLEQPDGQRELNNSNDEMGDAGDVWPYGSNSALTPTSNPNSLGYGQSSWQGKISIRNIARQSNGDITFDVEIAGTTPLLGLGAACTSASRCQSGFCVDGVCCNEACAAGPCDACSRAAGATADGYCAPVNAVCDDGFKCTTNDRCENRVCTGTPVVCDAGNQCVQGGSCNPATGQCTPSVPLPNGSPCDDGNLCTRADSCQDGQCVGANPVLCPTVGPCELVLACEPATGRCPIVLKPDGSWCDDNNACTTDDMCQYGMCAGSPKACPKGDECNGAGVCDVVTGECIQQPYEDGTECEGGTCQAGVCEPTPVVEAKAEKGCGGCSSGAAGPVALFGLLAGLALLRRRAIGW